MRKEGQSSGMGKDGKGERWGRAWGKGGSMRQKGA